MKKLYTITFALLLSGLTGNLLFGMEQPNESTALPVATNVTAHVTAYNTKKNNEYALITYNNHQEFHNKTSDAITLVEKIEKKYPSHQNRTFIEKSKEINELTAAIVSNVKRYDDPNNYDLMLLVEKHQDVAAEISRVLPEVKRLEKKYNDARRCTIS